MKRLIAMAAVSALLGVWTARAEDEVKTVNPTPAPVVAPAQAASHCLAIKDGVAVSCACSTDCKCKLSEDGKTCTCGKAVKECSLAGKFCCAPCLQVSDKACKCPKCGADMKAMPAKAADAPKAE